MATVAAHPSETFNPKLSIPNEHFSQMNMQPMWNMLALLVRFTGPLLSKSVCTRYGNECIQSHSDVSRRHDIYSACHAKGELQSVSLRAEVKMAGGINTILTLRPPAA